MKPATDKQTAFISVLIREIEYHKLEVKQTAGSDEFNKLHDYTPFLYMRRDLSNMMYRGFYWIAYCYED